MERALFELQVEQEYQIDYSQEQSWVGGTFYICIVVRFPNELKIPTSGLIRAYYVSAYQLQLLKVFSDRPIIQHTIM